MGGSVHLEALRVRVADGVELVLRDETRAWGRCDLALGDGMWGRVSDRDMGAEKPGDRPPFLYDATAPERGLNALRLFELRDYAWKLDGAGAAGGVVQSSLSAAGGGGRWFSHEPTHGRFRFDGFLGAAWIRVEMPGQPPFELPFEVASPKLDYENEYRGMVEAIARECGQLLLELGTPTTLRIAADPAREARALLEQFFFLRHVLDPERLGLWMETVQRSPHTRLRHERRWRPAGAAHPGLFALDPVRHGRGWHAGPCGPVPEEVREERKHDSADTPPNRFVKFALKRFRDLCNSVAGLPGRRAAVRAEATALAGALEAMLAAPFLADVGPLQRIPLESTTLQRREGYREILGAWLLLDAAAAIDWPGRDDVYKGDSRNVALLYEYWLYFVIARALRGELGMIPERDPAPADGGEGDGALPFCCKADDERVLIHLKQGSESFCRFRWSDGGRGLRVHFFFNRAFRFGAGVTRSGSYSRKFRPDYSLVLIPEAYDDANWLRAEERAEADGRIAYLHFDAKYRGERLSAVFGEDEEEDAEEGGTADKTAASSAKREDLYKMHTYNEAIRRTAGSYVLYPGRAGDGDDAHKSFRRYHEIVPGIGAFAIRPTRDNAAPPGLAKLVGFIGDVLRHHLTTFTQSYRVGYWTHETIRETAESFGGAVAPATMPPGLVDRPPKDVPVLLGYVRSEQEAELCREKRVFFCHGVEWDDPGSPDRKPAETSDLDFDPFRSELFVAYSSRQSAPWIAPVGEVKLVTARERADEQERPVEDMRAAYYYRFQLGQTVGYPRLDVSECVKRRPGKPVQHPLSKLAACPVVDDADAE